MRPLFARAVAEHEALAAEAGAERYLSRRGWLKLYRTDAAFAAQAGELELAANFGIAPVTLDRDGALALEPALAGVFRRAVHWTGAASVSNPLALTRAYAARFAALGGVDAAPATRARFTAPTGIGGSIPRRGRSTPAKPWSRSARGRRTCSMPLGMRLPLAVKRGYHRHFRPQGNAALSRPVLDAEIRLLPRADGAGHPPHDRR